MKWPDFFEAITTTTNARDDIKEENWRAQWHAACLAYSMTPVPADDERNFILKEIPKKAEAAAEAVTAGVMNTGESEETKASGEEATGTTGTFMTW